MLLMVTHVTNLIVTSTNLYYLKNVMATPLMVTKYDPLYKQFKKYLVHDARPSELSASRALKPGI